MSALTVENLSSKFRPFLIGSPTCPVDKEEIDAIFAKPLTNLKSDYIFEAGKWVLKLGRTDGCLTTPDTHLYRIRKAEKMRTYICQNNLEGHIAVPNKYLYWHEKENRFYVVAEKMDLSPEVGALASADIESTFKEAAPQVGGQMQALARNAPKRSLTPIQAEALAEMSFLGYTDLSYNNLYFTQDGRVAILDTEPQKRGLKKTLKSGFFGFGFWLNDKGALLIQQSLAGSAKLKLYIDNSDALKAVQKVERNHVLWSIAQLIVKIAVVSLAIHFTPAITALIPIAAVATTLKVSLVVAAYVKNIVLILNVIGVYSVWSFSDEGPQGVVRIVGMEQKAYF